MTNNVLEVNNLSKSFKGIPVLQDVSLKVQEGDIYGLLGKNGAGKSTTMKIILKLIKLDSGTIKLFDKYNIVETNHYLADIGSLIESPSFYPNLNAVENLKIIQRLANIPQFNIKKVLEIVGLQDVPKNKLVKNYSLGMKQRLGIALALLKFPKLIILDEPTNGLDPKGVKEIRQLIMSLPQKYGTTVLISSHILSEIEKMANRVAIINDGQIKYEGSIAELEQTSQLIIKTDNNRNAVSILKKHHYLVHKISENSIVLNNIGHNAVMKINYLLVTNGVGVYELHIVQNSLEDMFLKITEGE
ncbi:ABC transporter ATP-binding protein [Leuconostoc mesenteroides subsp. dextranicum]|jgi:ABC-2 type transport system ATP-binding protein|nr:MULTISPECIES: ABC transporter ATP-binding protein [Leuconostoc]KMY81004.1 ABC transporter ATP-binding protein [Leuconostoc mesenteroides subsp. dextranicum]MBZ1513292.1 ABC transporter ATP-binding protein [Leuconostoc mesenteroides]MBZ1519437.1 ABC transporter ATP-binding protein [Leuconostoc mesenteroides]MBZ1521495.1 ABC transporter ATP-binding protein [Leuconostoc mesenteroides]MBZ1530072.1 ABC transporter ATP-binding protein [Leuconostoc mesenteroides]